MAAPQSVLAPPVAIDVVFSNCYTIFIKMFKKLLAKIKKVTTVKKLFELYKQFCVQCLNVCLFVTDIPRSGVGEGYYGICGLLHPS